jgi:hypothetical protein
VVLDAHHTFEECDGPVPMSTMPHLMGPGGLGATYLERPWLPGSGFLANTNQPVGWLTIDDYTFHYE